MHFAAWLATAAFFFAFEAVTKLRLLGCWMGLGCLAAVPLSLVGAPSAVQYACAAAVALLTFRFLRDPALAKVESFLAAKRGGRLAAFYEKRVVGSVVVCKQDMPHRTACGTVATQGGVEYPAFLDAEGALLAGDAAFVKERVGGKLAVVPMKEAGDE